MLAWLRFILAAVCFLVGLFFVFTAIFGVNKFHFILNRMHAAALGDSLGILFIFLGCIFLTGFTMASLKYLLVILFFWFAGPVSSHLIARLEVTTNEELEKECKVEKRERRRGHEQ